MKKYKNQLIILLILSIGILVFLLKDDFSAVVKEFFAANIWLIILAAYIYLLYWFLRAVVLYRITKQFVSDFKFKEAFYLMLISQFFNGVTPFSSGGQPGIIYLMSRRGISISKSTNIMIQDTIIYQVAFSITGLIAIALNHIFHIFPEVTLLKYLVIIGYAINLFIILLLYILSFGGKKIKSSIINLFVNFLSFLRLIKQKQKKIEKWNKYLEDFHEGAKYLFSNKIEFIKEVIIMIIGIVVTFIGPFVLIASVTSVANINLLYTMVATGYITIIGSFIPMPGGTGGIEYGFMAFFCYFIDGSTLTAIMLLWRFVTYYLGMALGMVTLFIYKPDKYKKNI